MNRARPKQDKQHIHVWMEKFWPSPKPFWCIECGADGFRQVGDIDGETGKVIR